MDSLWIDCAGATVGQLVIPAFRLRAREAVCLHMPVPVSTRHVVELAGILTGAVPVPGLQRHGLVLEARPAAPAKTLLRTLFGGPTVGRWLRGEAGLPPAEARAALGRLGLRGDERFFRLSYNPRVLLGLEVAYGRGCDAVLFSTTGCDPMGVEAVHASVAARLPRCAAVQFCYAQIGGDRYSCLARRRELFSRATCLDVQVTAATAPLLTTSEGGS